MKKKAATSNRYSAGSCHGSTYNGAIWAIAHRLGRLVWKILHDGVRYLEQGEETNPKAKKRRAQKMVQALRRLGYNVVISSLPPQPAQG